MYANRSDIKQLWPSGRQLLQGPAIEPLTIQEVGTQIRFDASNTEPTPPAPSIAMAGLGVGLVTNGVHRYCVTFVTAVGETNAGVQTDQITVVNNAVDGKISLTNIALGGSLVTARRIYRTLAGGTNFFLVATINDNVTTVYVDNIADGALGAGVPVTNTTQDPEVSSMIVSARMVTEKELRRPLITQKWRFYYDGLPDNDQHVIYVPLPPLQTVDFFKYQQWTDGTLADVLAVVYQVDTTSLPGRIIKKFAQLWPVVYPQLQSVYIDVTCGYGPARSDVPQPIKDGMKMLIAGMWRNRISHVPETLNVSPVIMKLWEEYRYREF